MRRVVGLAVVLAAVALAIVVGQRMSTEAMAVVVGVVFGVAASIPTSLLVIAATRRRGPNEASAVDRRDELRPPQVIVIQQPAALLEPQRDEQWMHRPWQNATTQQGRTFTLLGDDD